MDLNIYYDIRNHGKYETLRTNDKTIKKYIDDAQNYYKLKEKFESNEAYIVYLFRTGDFTLYLLNQNISFEHETNIKIDFIKKYLQESISNKKYFTKPVFLSFIRDVLQIGNFDYTVSEYSSKYYTDSDIKNGMNLKNIQSKLETFQKNKRQIIVDKTYTCKDLITFILVSLLEMIDNKIQVHRCINCGRIFIANNSQTNCNKYYCNYISPQNAKKTCFNYRQNIRIQ